MPAVSNPDAEPKNQPPPPDRRLTPAANRHDRREFLSEFICLFCYCYLFFLVRLRFQ